MSAFCVGITIRRIIDAGLYRTHDGRLGPFRLGLQRLKDDLGLSLNI